MSSFSSSLHKEDTNKKRGPKTPNFRLHHGAVKNSQLAVILATAKKDTNTFSYAYQGQTIVFGPYSALGKLPVLLAGSKAAFLGDVLDFTKLSTTTLTQLLSDNTSLQ
jgi:hypothetical protein